MRRFWIKTGLTLMTVLTMSSVMFAAGSPVEASNPVDKSKIVCENYNRLKSRSTSPWFSAGGEVIASSFKQGRSGGGYWIRARQYQEKSNTTIYYRRCYYGTEIVHPMVFAYSKRYAENDYPRRYRTCTGRFYRGALNFQGKTCGSWTYVLRNPNPLRYIGTGDFYGNR